MTVSGDKYMMKYKFLKKIGILLLLLSVAGIIGNAYAEDTNTPSTAGNDAKDEFVDKIVPPTVLIDDIHRTEYDGYDLQTVFATLVDELEARGYVVDFASEVGFNPWGYSYVMIVDPRNPFTDLEKIRLKTFLNNGGRLILLGEWYPYSDNVIINDLSSYLGTGITFNQDWVADSTNNDQYVDWPIIYNFADHPITEGLSEIAIYAGCSLTLSGSATALASGDYDTYTVHWGWRFAKEELKSVGGSVEVKDIVPPAGGNVVKDIVQGSPIVAAYSTVGSGDVFAIGDVNIFADDIYGYDIGINRYDNLQLALNVFEATPSPHEQTVEVTTDQTVYQGGDTMQVSITITNSGESVTVGFVWELQLPIFWITIPIYQGPITLPAHSQLPINVSLTLPSGLPSLDAAWHVAIYNVTTRELIDEDYAYWQYVGSEKAGKISKEKLDELYKLVQGIDFEI